MRRMTDLFDSCAVYYRTMANQTFLTSTLAGLILASLPAQNVSAAALSAVSDVDLVRYSGTWYEIARLPNTFQKQCVGNVTATYTMLDDKEIQVVNRCKTRKGEITEAEGRARKADESGPNSKLKVRFAPAWVSWLSFVWGDYWIIELASDYSYAVIGEPRLRYFWVLSRNKTMDPALLDGILERAKKQGYDFTKLVKTNHD
jgi:apolipoprotein D and lipocalin family protein